MGLGRTRCAEFLVGDNNFSMKLCEFPKNQDVYLPDLKFTVSARPDLPGMPPMLFARLRALNGKDTQLSALFSDPRQDISEETLEFWTYKLLKAAYVPKPFYKIWWGKLRTRWRDWGRG